MKSAGEQGGCRVFVYGTLQTGGSQHRRMKGARRVGSGRVFGMLYRVDWYPAVVLGGQGVVTGEVYEVTADQLADLDDYEGGEYRRVRVPVEGEAAGAAWVWEWNRPVAGLEVVSGGDWLGGDDGR